MDNLLRFKKPLLFIAAALVIVEIAWGAYTLTRPLPSGSAASAGASNNAEETPKAVASLLGPSTATVGQNFKVDVELSSTSPAQGADLIVKYDPKVLELVKVKQEAATVGKVFTDYPANSADNSGIITISGVTPSTGFSGKGVFATLNFKVITKGKTNISFDYKMGSTTDSNVTESASGSDILGKVNNLEVLIN
jgi:hypothetical protein